MQPEISRKSLMIIQKIHVERVAQSTEKHLFFLGNMLAGEPMQWTVGVTRWAMKNTKKISDPFPLLRKNIM